jgi:hypothetical protein
LLHRKIFAPHLHLCSDLAELYNLSYCFYHCPVTCAEMQCTTYHYCIVRLHACLIS